MSALVRQREAPLPPVLREELPGGAQALLVPDSDSGLVYLSWVARAGSLYEDEANRGVAALLPALLKQGTAERDGGELAEALSELGTDLLVGSSWDRAYVALQLLSGDLQPSLSLMTKVVNQPAFAASAVVRGRAHQLLAIQRRSQQAAALAEDALAASVFGSGAYGRPRLGTASSVAMLDDAAVRRFHQQHFRQQDLCMLLVGEFEPRAVLDQIAALTRPGAGHSAAASSFNPRPADRIARIPVEKSGPAPHPSLVSEACARCVFGKEAMSPGSKEPVLLPVAGSSLVELRLGHRAPCRCAPDIPALGLLSALLAAVPGGRLYQALRRDLGWIYAVKARFIPRLSEGLFELSLAVPPKFAARAVAIVRQELQRLCNEPVSSVELEAARRHRVCLFWQWMQTHLGVARQLAELVLDAAPGSSLGSALHTLETLQAPQVLELAQRYLRPGELHVAAAGPEEALDELRAGLASEEFEGLR